MSDPTTLLDVLHRVAASTCSPRCRALRRKPAAARVRLAAPSLALSPVDVGHPGRRFEQPIASTRGYFEGPEFTASVSYPPPLAVRLVGVALEVDVRGDSDRSGRRKSDTDRGRIQVRLELL